MPAFSRMAASICESSSCATMIGEQALGVGERHGTALHQLAGQFAGAVHQFFRRNDLVQEADAQRFFGVEDASGEQQVAGDFFADLPQQEGRDDGGHESDADFGVSELCFRNGKREIAEQGKPGPAGNGSAIDRGNRRLGEFVERPEKDDDGARVLEILLGRACRSGLSGCRGPSPSGKSLACAG